MTLRTLLLGGAAAFLTVGAAQAADLGAEPANYVKVCDAFGPGFYYAPGTDTCIKIGGYVFLDVNIYADNTSTAGTNNWMYATEAAVQVTASSMTEYGPLVGYIEIVANGGSGVQGVLGMAPAKVDNAWLSLGPLLAGYTWSQFNPTFLLIDGGWNLTGNTRLNQIRLSWAANGISFGVAAEDFSARTIGVNVTNMPDLTAAINASLGGVNLHLGAGYGQRSNGGGGSVYGLSGTASLGLGSVANLLIGANYSSGGNDWVSSFLIPAFGGLGGTGFDGQTYYSIYGQLGLNLSSQFSAAVAGGYYARNGVNTYNQIIGNVTFRPVTNFSVAAEVVAAQGNGTALTAWTTTGKIRLRRDFP